MAAPLVTVQQYLTNAYIGGRTVTFTHVSGCSEAYSFTVTAGTGTRIALPYGTWVVTIASISGTAPTVVLSPGNKQPTVALKVTA
jgi:hypothetical protein